MRVNFVEIENYLVKIGWSMRLVVFNITVFRVKRHYKYVYYTWKYQNQATSEYGK